VEHCICPSKVVLSDSGKLQRHKKGAVKKDEPKQPKRKITRKSK